MVVWEAIFLLIVLKIPVVYVCCVVWWAIRAEPKPFDGLEPALVYDAAGDRSAAGRRPAPLSAFPRPGSARPPLRTYSRRPARVTA